METLLVLKKTKELLSDPKHWTQGVPALDKNSMSVNASSPEATSWCLAGALWNITDGTNEDYDAAYRACFAIAYDRCGGPFLTDYNDDADTTHADILSLLDEAIAVTK